MSITSLSNRWLNRVYKTLAILLVLVAVLISACRLLLPYLDNHHQTLQNYINKTYQTDLDINTLSLSWQASGPVLIAKKVRLLDNAQVQAFIDHLEISIDFWSSVLNQRLVTNNLVLRGASVELDKQLLLRDNIDPKATATHSANTSETPTLIDPNKAKKPDNASNEINIFSHLFLQQISRFSLLNSQVVINDGDKKRLFLISKLNWLNHGDRHQAQGGVIVDGVSSNNLRVSLDFKGNDFSDMTGQLYVQANHLDITPWLESVIAIDNDRTNSDINFSAWLNMQQGKFEQLQIDFDENKVSWLYNDKPQQLVLGAGQLQVAKAIKNRRLKLESNALSLQINEQNKHEFSLQGWKQSDEYFAYLSSIDLSFLKQLTPLFSSEETQRELFSHLDLSGSVSDVFLQKKENKIHMLASFSQVNSGFSQGVPGIKNASGSVDFNDQKLHVSLKAQSGALDFAHHFIKPIPYHSINADINVDINEQGWQLSSNNLALVSDELTLNADIAIEAPKNADVVMSLLATAKNADVSVANHYYPLTSMSKPLISYLNKALVKGALPQAVVLFNGPLRAFPFEDHSGIFVVDAELAKGTFSFDDKWPSIDDFSANLNFTNNGMLITGRKGSLTGLDVTGVTAAIPDLAGEGVLLVDTVIKSTSANHVAQLMNESPLKKSVGAVLEQLKVAGNIHGDFHLNLPLNAVENVIAQGDIHFEDNDIALQTPKMDFSHVKGQLSFKNDFISTKNLALTWQGLPLALNVSGGDKTDYYNTTIDIKTLWQENDWQQKIPTLLKEYVKGDVEWQGHIALYQHHDGDFSYDANLNSDLKNVLFNLPAPYEKTNNSKVPFQLTVNGDYSQSTINAEMGKNMSFYGVLNHKKASFLRAHLMLGDEKMLLPTNGFHITTKLDSADFSEWQPVISNIVNSIEQSNSAGIIQPSETAKNDSSSQSQVNLPLTTQTVSLVGLSDHYPLFAKPERIRGTVGKLAILGQNLNNVSFNLLDKKEWWLLQLNAKEIRSRMKFYPDWLTQGVDVDADFIQLHVMDDAKSNINTNINTNSNTTDNALASAPTKADAGIKTELTPLQKPEQKLTHEESAEIFSSIPRIKLHCDRCLIGLLDLGEVDFTIDRNKDNVIALSSFKTKRPGASVNITGQWLFNQQQSQTSLQGNVSIKDIEDELSAFDYASIIKDSGGKADFNLNWQGGPQAFSLGQLNGDISAKTDDGYLADVSDKAKIFSVLSLQSIVRKLTLDFRDIFSDGMFYSTIKGDYHLANGVLYTKNMKMNGTAGDLVIKGNTNLATSLLDLKMSYKPNLTSSLPVLAWIATLNPATFLAGVAIDQVFTSKVVSEFNFELTGSVNNPDFKEVNRKTRDVNVGRSTPPKFVDGNLETEGKQLETKKKQPNKPENFSTDGIPITSNDNLNSEIQSKPVTLNTTSMNGFIHD